MNTRLIIWRWLVSFWIFFAACQEEPTPESKVVVILYDCTMSTQPSQATANQEFVSRALAKLSSKDEVWILGITESSFGHSRILLHAKLPTDDDPLEIVLQPARDSLIVRWNAIADTLKLNSRETDIFGAVNYASLILQGKRGEKWMIVISDFRQSTKKFAIEDMEEIPVEQTLHRLRQEMLIPDLTSVHCAVISMHTRGKSMQYYHSLEELVRRFLQDEAHSDLVVVRADQAWEPFSHER